MLALTGEAFHGRIQQKSHNYQRTNATLRADDLFVSPSVGLNLRAGTEDYGKAGRVNVGQVGAKYFFEDGSDVSVRLHRDSLWSDHDQRDPRQFNRVTDLTRLGPSFTVQGASAAADKVVRPGRHVRIETGSTKYEDNNSRSFVYAHYQSEIGYGGEAWTAIRPNIYWESFRRTSPGYFSPASFFSVGNAFHTIRGNQHWNVEAKINPQGLFTQSQKGFGIDGVLDVKWQLGPTSIGVGTFAFYDHPAHYTIWRAVAEVRVRLR